MPKGLERQIDALKSADNMRLDVGWFETEIYPPDKERNRKGGIPIAQVAYWNEFGNARIPSRPFMRKAASQGQKKVTALAAQLSAQVLAGTMPIETALKQIGLLMEGEVVDSIKNGGWKKNSKITVDGSPPDKNGKQFIKGKGFDKPLIDSSLMFQKVASKVTKE
ncbi:tail completion or Neck1 protein [Burkholderia phage Bm1]